MGRARRAASWICSPACSLGATPLEARYLLRLVTGGPRLGVGTPTILDALAQVHAGGRAARPVLERAYNICCDLG
jgi:DNA ligase-1